ILHVVLALYWTYCCLLFFFFSSRRRHTRSKRDWSSDVCSSDLLHQHYCTVSKKGTDVRTLAPGYYISRRAKLTENFPPLPLKIHSNYSLHLFSIKTNRLLGMY